MTMDNLWEILDQHKKWLNHEEGGSRADLRGADLRDIELCGANLREAFLTNANLSGADLSGAKLSDAALTGANLTGANLAGADLSGANLYGAVLTGVHLYGAKLYGARLCDADLSGADLREASLSSANLCDANLHGADLGGADLQYASLVRANLEGVNLRGADLRDAKLRGVRNLSDLPWTSIVPETGSFIGWAHVHRTDHMVFIVKLEILADAKRCNATGRECRCSAAKVLEIQKPDGTPAGLDSVVNHDYIWQHDTLYVVGETVLPDRFDDDRWDERGHGIYFFITRQEAVDC